MYNSSKNFYFETSAINYLVNKYSIEDAIATRAFQYAKGNIFYISSVGIWEVLLTTNDIEREKILYFSQHFFHNKLVKSPSEFIINYINSGCPMIEHPYNLETDLDLGDVWEDICINTDKTMIFDKEYLIEKTKYIKSVYKKIGLIINRITLDINVKDDIFYNQELVNYFSTSLNKEFGPFEEKEIKLYKLTTLFILYTICFEFEIDSSAYINFWSILKIPQSVDRLFYIYENYRTLFLYGPFYNMALMAYHQISSGQKKNRGLFLDCLHTIYITYFDIFITNDKHFKSFSENFINMNTSKIRHIEDIIFSSHKVPIQPRNTFLK
jgi:hypothetical protein